MKYAFYLLAAVSALVFIYNAIKLGDRLSRPLLHLITEEKIRLKSHCDYFIETLKNADANGKKLGFITQEIGREINTLGSKANDANIQKLVVGMKEELEKIKEQLLNVL